MSIEILTVSLSPDSVEQVAQRVTQLLSNKTNTEGNQGSPQNPQPAEPSGFQPQADPWTNSAPPQAAPQQAPPPLGPGPQYTQPVPQSPQSVPMCAHGPKKWVEPGFSKTTGRAYQGFWACPAPRGQQCPRS